MSTNKTRLNAASVKLALAAVAPAAFAEGQSREAVAAALRACGVRYVDPDKLTKGETARQNAIRREYIVGRMAARLASNEPADVRLDSARDHLDNYGGWLNPKDYAKGGKHAGKEMPKLPKGKVGRRSKEQEKAYSAARVALSQMLGYMGIKALDGRGGDTSKTRAPRQTAAKESNVVQLPKAKSPQEAVSFVAQQAAMLLMYCDKNDSIDLKVRAAVVAFNASIEPFKSL